MQGLFGVQLVTRRGAPREPVSRPDQLPAAWARQHAEQHETGAPTAVADAADKCKNDGMTANTSRRLPESSDCVTGFTLWAQGRLRLLMVAIVVV